MRNTTWHSPVWRWTCRTAFPFRGCSPVFSRDHRPNNNSFGEQLILKRFHIWLHTRRKEERRCFTPRLRLSIYCIFSPNQFSLWYKIAGVLTVKTNFKATGAEDNEVVSSVQIFCTGMRMPVYQRKFWLNTKQSEQPKPRRSSSPAC